MKRFVSIAAPGFEETHCGRLGWGEPPRVLHIHKFLETLAGGSCLFAQGEPGDTEDREGEGGVRGGG